MTTLVTPRLLLRGLLVSLAMAAALSSMTPASGTGAGLWSQTGSMAEARYTHTLTLLPDGTVLAAGGCDAVYQGLASAELYDPDTNTWSLTGSLAEARIGHTATLLSDGSGRVLVTGGLGADRNPLASAELYDPAAAPGTDPWSSAASMTEARYSPTATLLPSGKVLVTGGGYGGESELASAELYDPGTNCWSSAGSIAERRGTHTATLVTMADDKVKVLVAGGINTVKKGRNHKINYLVSAELYDPDAAPATDPSSSTGSMATVRFLPTATPLSDGRVLVAGGQDLDSNTASAEIYDPATDPQTGTLTGTVTDASILNPIKGVTVTIRETGQSAKTDLSGAYTITDCGLGISQY